ncbi:MAG: nucleotidyltransferase family protein [Pseudomonadota bacterium]
MAARATVPEALLNSVIAYFNPRRVILFGSAARGEVGPDSDYDLLVIVDDDTPKERRTLRAGFEASRSYPRSADVIPCRESIFQRQSKIIGSLAHTIAQEGVVVYARA